MAGRWPAAKAWCPDASRLSALAAGLKESFAQSFARCRRAEEAKGHQRLPRTHGCLGSMEVAADASSCSRFAGSSVVRAGPCFYECYLCDRRYSYPIVVPCCSLSRHDPEKTTMSYTYRYDALGRLSQATAAGRDTTYTYDRNSNLINETVVSGGQTVST